jgi:hypothetical protein
MIQNFKKFIIIVSIIPLFCNCTNFEEDDLETNPNLVYKSYYDETKHLYGFINKQGEIIVPPTYTYVGYSSEGLIPVNINGKWGFVNQLGDVVAEANYIYVNGFSEGMASVIINSDYSGGFDKESLKYMNEFIGKWGFIDTGGNIKIGSRFDYAGNFHFGLAPVKINSKWGYINKDGKFAIGPNFFMANDFQENLALVEDSSLGLYGYITTSGEYIISPRYYFAGNFSNGLAPVCESPSHDSWGYIDKNGDYIIKPQFRDAHEFDEYGRAEVVAKCLPTAGCSYTKTNIYLSDYIKKENPLIRFIKKIFSK